METSIFISKILAVIYLAFGFGLLLNVDYYKKALAKFMDDSSVIILGGEIAIIVGFLIIEHHNIWANDWTVIITILGWIALIKGIVLLIYPKYVSFFKPMLTKLKILIPIILLLGLVFTYFGFIV